MFNNIKFKKGIVAVQLLSLGLLFPLSSVSAQGVDINTQLAALSASLTNIGNLIAASPNLKDADRLVLMNQLIAISNQILAIKTAGYGSYSLDDYLNPPPDSDATKTAAEDAGLDRVKVKYDHKTNVATVEIYYGSKIEKSTHNFSEVSAVSEFLPKMDKLRKVLAAKISTDTGIKQGDIEDLIRVSAYDPVRDKLITVNSPIANYLAENFALNSIVNKVEVRPGDGVGQIEIYTDQNESLLLTIAEETDPDGWYYSKPKYTYSYQMFFSSPLDFISYSYEDSTEPKPKVSNVTTGVEKDDIYEYIAQMFDGVPFTSKISDFEGKLLRFLQENKTYYRYWSGIPKDSVLDCYYGTDKAVVSEFIKYLVTGVAAQHDDLDKIIKYKAPAVSDDNYSGCSAKKRYF